MNKPETKILDDILELNKTALTQYELLAELDIEGKKKSLEYKNTIRNIKLIASIIEKKLANLKISSKDLFLYEKQLAERHNFDDEDIIAETLYQNTHDAAAKRLSIQIFNYSLLNYCYTIDEEYTDPDYEYNEELDEIISDDANKEIDFDFVKDRLLIHTLLSYLEKAIKKETNNEVKNILIRTKYNVIYLLYPIEYDFLKKQTNYVNPTTYQEIIGNHTENVDIEELFIQPNEETITYHLESIAEIPDEYYDDFLNNVKVYILSIYIKTLISINISEYTDSRLKDFRKSLQLKSEKSKKYVDEAYKVSKKLSVVKKVDL